MKRTVNKMSAEQLEQLFLEVAKKNREKLKKHSDMQTKVSFIEKIKNIFIKPQENCEEKEEEITYQTIEDALGDWDIVQKDLSEVYFGLENYEINDEYISNKENNLMGFKTLKNGFTFLGCYGGADYELPVFFIIYHDGENFRGYVPKQGNNFNAIMNTAFGIENDIDAYYELSDEEQEYVEKLCTEAMDEEKEFDWLELKNDILNNIKIIN